MKKRYARGISLAITAGLVMSGAAMSSGAAMATESSPTVDIGWAAGKPAPFGGTRFDGALVGKKVYFLGFRLADNSTDGSIWVYNVEKKKYSDTGIDMAVPISNYTVAVLEDKKGLGLYTFGGRDALGETTTTVQVFYPKTGETKVIASDPWPGMTPSECVSLPATGVAVVDNTAYVLGGMSFSTSVPACVDDNSKQVWSFRPKADNGKKWKKLPNLKEARGYVAPAVIGNKIYAIGGDVNAAGALTASPAVESWKIGAAKFSGGPADLPVGCDETQAFAFDGGPLGDTITLGGCGQWPNAITDVYQYDVAGDSWDMVGSLLEARRNHAGVNIGTQSNPKLFVLGGYNLDGSAVLTTSEIGTEGGLQGTGAPPAAPIPGGKPSVF